MQPCGGQCRQISAQQISHRAVYLPIIGSSPSEDYRPYIERGGVWILEVRHEPAGVIVLAENPAYLLVYSVAVKPKHPEKGYATALFGLLFNTLSQSVPRLFGCTPISAWSETLRYIVTVASL
jgi:hypothetical protein